MLIKASKMQQKVKMEDMLFSGIEIEVGVIPNVRIKYTQK
jgi:hypothetical protein